MRYPLVELATALLFVMTYDAMFVSDMRSGVSWMGADWPLLIGHWLLWSGLIALSVMDLEAYLVDIRITWLLSAVGVVMHTFWTPNLSTFQPGGWIRPGVEGSGFAIGVTLGLFVTAWVSLRSRTEPPLEQCTDEPVIQTETTVAPKSPVAGHIVLAMAIALVTGYMLLLIEPAYAGVLGLGGDQTGAAVSEQFAVGGARLLAGCALLFVGLAMVAGEPQPEADVEIVEAIQAEAPDSRRVVISELLFLSPALAVGVGILLLCGLVPAVREWLLCALIWEPVSELKPVWGMSTGLAGLVVGGAIGWVTRIGFTLVFGKEALGLGDIHIMAAIGAVAGWPVAFLGFFIAAPLTLLALVAIAFRRQSRALPYGPWLALGAFIMFIHMDHVLRYLGVRWLFETTLE